MKWQQFLRWTSLSIASLVTGCTTTMSSSRAAATPISQNLPAINLQSSSSYLSQASSSTGNAQYEYQLLATARFLQDGDVNSANQLLMQLKSAPLSPMQRTQFFIVQAGTATAADDPYFAAKVLSKVSNIQSLSSTWQLLYWQTAFSTYYRSNNKPNGLYAQIKFLQLTDNLTPKNMAPLWQELQTLPTSSLNTFANSTDPMIQGWGKLTLAVEQNANQPKNLVAAINDWQNRYPSHPANQLIPNNQILTAASTTPAPTQIALLVPITGQYAAMGKAVRDGFMTAYFNESSLSAGKATIKVYDTNNASISSLYQQAVANGAQVVVGPLLKQDVAQLADTSSLAVPTIALNYSDNSVSSPQMIEMGLSPQIAAQQAANLAWQHGSSKLLVLTADNSWASNVSQSFISQWQGLGGQVMDNVTLSNDPKALSNQIAQALKVNQGQLQALAQQKNVRNKLVYSAHRRNDINGIFLLAPPDLARQVEPLLKFYFAGNLPVYSTSYIYNGLPDPTRNRDLDGTLFNDIPWVLNNTPNIANARQQISNAWQSNYRANPRLFAVGYDAYILSTQFSRVVNMPTFGVDGVTGKLFLYNQQVIGQLTNAVVRQGYAQALPW